ncbi:MAG: hypothetical protein ABIM99_01805 [Candidatus Dojkabacteria bacterium]
MEVKDNNDEDSNDGNEIFPVNIPVDLYLCIHEVERKLDLRMFSYLVSLALSCYKQSLDFGEIRNDLEITMFDNSEGRILEILSACEELARDLIKNKDFPPRAWDEFFANLGVAFASLEKVPLDFLSGHKLIQTKFIGYVSKDPSELYYPGTLGKGIRIYPRLGWIECIDGRLIYGYTLDVAYTVDFLNYIDDF